MKKIAIYTIVSRNIGNRLQNYAVQKVLSNFGYRTETIRKRPYSLKMHIKHSIRSIVKKDQFTNYFLFNRKIKWSRMYVNKDNISLNINSKYDYFVIGSDQVWNPEFDFSSRNDYLPFITDKPIVAYAASFGVDHIEENQETIASDLKRMKSISVREKSGAKIVKELSGRDATVVVDPTLMLNAEEWMKLSKAPKKVDCNKPYILTYFLGGRSQKVNEECEKIAKENGLLLYHLMEKESQELYSVGPSEFIYLIAHAQLILTDSFHASVFSFLFQKPFLVYTREDYGDSMMSRINTLFESFKLQRKFVNSGIANDLFECDYSDGYKQLEEEREKTRDYLIKALSE